MIKKANCLKDLRRLSVLILLGAFVTVSLFAQTTTITRSTFLSSTTWKLRSEAIDANKNGQLDESEKMPVTKEKVAYKFNEDGTGTYYPGTPGGPKETPITWKLTPEGDRLRIVMEGATFSYHIQELDKKHLVLETKTVDGKGWEIYGRK